MNDTSLHADCVRCAALCCVAFPFDASNQFAFDKRAGEPCPHLGTRGVCGIYTDRKARGFAGCIGYSCFGAGQRVTQELFGGRSWQEEPSLLLPMIEAFHHMRLVHELLLLLDEAGKLPLTSRDRHIQEQLLARLRPETEWSLASLAAFDIGTVQSQVQIFLRSLRSYIPVKKKEDCTSETLPMRKGLT